MAETEVVVLDDPAELRVIEHQWPTSYRGNGIQRPSIHFG